MSRTRKYVLGGLAAAGVGVAALAVSGVGGQTLNTAKLELIGSAAAAGGHHGWRGGGRHGGMRRLCSPARAEKLEDAIGFAEAFFSFNDAQKTAWTGLTAALREGSETIGQRCEALREEGRPATATAKLARMETMLGAGYDIVQKVRPKFDAFYATLSEGQRAALDKLIERRHRRGGDDRPDRSGGSDNR